MGTAKRERKKAGHRARVQVERRLDRRDRRRRLALTTAAVIVGVIAVVGLFVAVSKPGTPSAATASQAKTSSSTTTSTLKSKLPSAAGKPCVDLVDPLPAGAPNVVMPVGTVPTSLLTENLIVGTGQPVAATDTVTVNYIGVACSTGKIFDSSWSRGEAATFGLDQVIPGWTQGLVGMQPGGRRTLIIPASLAYGSEGEGQAIAPDEALIFVVDLVSARPPTMTTVAPN